MEGKQAVDMELFDAHCHLHDPRIIDIAPHVISNALDSGVVYVAVEGIRENDWHLVKEMGGTYPSIIPNFGMHPWYMSKKTPSWFGSLESFLRSTPTAAVGEIGLDKSALAEDNDFNDQLDACMKQLQLAKKPNRPVSVHCLSAFDELYEQMKSLEGFPAGLILLSYAGSAEWVPKFAELRAYFSFSGHLMSRDVEDARKMLKVVPLDRFLLRVSQL